MAKMSCFSILLTGRRQKRVQVGDADKGAGIGNESPRVKPVAVESTAALPPLAAAVVDKCGDKIVADVLIVVAHKGGETSPVKRDSCLSDDFEFEFHPHPNKLVGSDVHGADKHATGTVPDSAVIASAGEEAAVAEVEVDPSAKLKRSCSNIETKRPGPRDAPGMRVRSRSYGDLPGDLFMVTTPRRAHEASPDASVKTSRTADRVMLKRRSSSQVLPSRSRKLWWRLFLWSHRNLHRSWSARPSDAGTPGGGYTSDTLEEPADRKNKKAMVEESPPQPPSQNQWVAFCADHSLSDRVSEWVSSIDNSECLRIAEEEDDVGGDQSMDLADCVARPRPIEAGETSGKGGHGKLAKRCAAADDVAQANSIVQSLNGFSSVAHISGMGLKVVPMIAPFSNLRAVNLSGNFIGPALAGSVAEQDRKRRGAPGADEAARAQPQLQPDLAHRPRAVELHGDQGAVPGGEQDRRRGGPAPAAEAGGAGPGLQQAHHRQGAGPAGGQLPLPPGAQPGGQPRAGQRRRRRAAQGRHRPPPAARIPQQAAPQATGGGHRQRRARGTRRRRNVGPQAGCVAAAHPEPRIVVVVQEQVQRQAAPRLERHGKEVNK